MDLNLIHQLIVPLVVPFITQFVKRVEVIPIAEGQTARIRTFAAVATFVLSALTAYLDGHLSSFLSPQMVEVGLVSVFSFAMAHFGYQAVKVINQSNV